MNNKIRVLSIFVAMSLALTSCAVPKKVSNEKSVGSQVEVTAAKSDAGTDKADVFVEKQTKYAQDKTTEVLIDNEINFEDIKKIVKHGDHWHVFTKDGRERITYTDPNLLKKVAKISAGKNSRLNQSAPRLEFVSVISLDQLRELPITVIKKHGDHYHCYTADGTEYITYENPSAAFPNITITKYVGSHGHGHGHGHGQNNANNIQLSMRGGNYGEEINGGYGVGASTSGRSGDDVVQILRHGDHWHVYTADGSEFITYDDPTSMYPNASVGVYHGSHGSHGGHGGHGTTPAPAPQYEHSNDSSSDSEGPSGGHSSVKPHIKRIYPIKPSQMKEKGIVKILKHEDHYHVYDANGKEYIIFDSNDDEIKQNCPDVTIGDYEKEKHGKGENHENDSDCSLTAIPQDPNDPNRITRILKHGSHWHLYKANGDPAGIEYCDAQILYPDATVGDYEEEMRKQEEKVKEADIDSANTDLKIAFLKQHYSGCENVLNIGATFYVYFSEDKYESDSITVEATSLKVSGGVVTVADGASLPEAPKLKAVAKPDNAVDPATTPAKPAKPAKPAENNDGQITNGESTAAPTENGHVAPGDHSRDNASTAGNAAGAVPAQPEISQNNNKPEQQPAPGSETAAPVKEKPVEGSNSANSNKEMEKEAEVNNVSPAVSSEPAPDGKPSETPSENDSNN